MCYTYGAARFPLEAKISKGHKLQSKSLKRKIPQVSKRPSRHSTLTRKLMMSLSVWEPRAAAPAATSLACTLSSEML